MEYNKLFKKISEKTDFEGHLIGFDNGVYDLKKREFRSFCPEDLVTKSVGYNYTTECEYNDEIKLFFRQVFPELEVHHL